MAQVSGFEITCETFLGKNLAAGSPKVREKPLECQNKFGVDPKPPTQTPGTHFLRLFFGGTTTCAAKDGFPMLSGAR